MTAIESLLKYVIISVIAATLPSSIADGQLTHADVPSGIMQLFHPSDTVGQSTGVLFAEGSSHNLDKKDSKNSDLNSTNTLSLIKGNATKNNSIENTTSSTVSSQKVTNQSSDYSPFTLNFNKTYNNEGLLLGGPEVEHINGISSIKARKGVDFLSKVPEENENDKDIGVSLPLNESCKAINYKSCFNVSQFPNIKCHCCNESNSLGRDIALHSYSNCTLCKDACSWCCKNISLSSNVTSSSNETFVHKLLPTDSVLHNVTELKSLNTTSAPVTKKPDHYMNIIEVPYDRDITAVPVDQSKRDAIIPIFVSILILPLIGVLFFFIYRKTRDCWDKRYYRRMDFLIDGIYND